MVSSSSNPSIIRSGNTLGTGTSDNPVVRSHNEMIFSQLKNSLSQLNSDSSYRNGLSSLNDSLSQSINSSTDLNSLIQDMYSSLEKVSEDPTNKSLHVDFKSKLQSVLDRKDSLVSTLDSSIENTSLKIGNTRSTIQSKLKDFDDLSQKIAEYEAGNSSSMKNRYLNDLRDKRDLIEQDLSSLSSFRVQKNCSCW